MKFNSFQPVALVTSLLFGSLFSSLVVAAPQQLYKVELIVFAHITPAALNSESWPANPEMPSMLKVKNLTAMPVQAPVGSVAQSANPSSMPDTQAKLYQIMTPTQLDLSDVVTSLKADKDYLPLVHAAWLQPGLPVNNSPRIHLYGGQAYNNEGKPINAVSPLLAFDATDAPALDQSSVPQSASEWQVNGYVRVSRPYLFQIDADLVLTIPHAELEKIIPSVADDIKTDHFVMQQTFRLKLGELYYIDNPLFGVLVRVDKYPQKKT